jgi:hypothetical protein
MGKAFHFCNPETFRFSTLFSLLQELGFDLRVEDYVVWRDHLMAFTMQSGDNALFPLMHL